MEKLFGGMCDLEDDRTRGEQGVGLESSNEFRRMTAGPLSVSTGGYRTGVREAFISVFRGGADMIVYSLG